jgi:hypothetical protein
MSGAAEQSATCGTVRPALGPVSQRQANLGLPDLERLNTILCSVTNSLALIHCPALLQLGNDRKHIRCSDHRHHHCIRVRSVLDDDSDYMSFFCILIPSHYPITNVSGCEPST